MKQSGGELSSSWQDAVSGVEINDVFFAVHALVLTLFTLGQLYYYERGDQKVTLVIKIIFGGFVSVLVVAAIVVIMGGNSGFTSWLNWLYLASYCKVGISLIKYMPQLIMNYQRKSTVGWSIINILLDLTGGLLSILQMLIDASVSHDWTVVTGNPAKFILGQISIFFDIAFILQHYVFYRDARKVEAPEQEIEKGIYSAKSDTGDYEGGKLNAPTPRHGNIGRLSSMEEFMERNSNFEAVNAAK